MVDGHAMQLWWLTSWYLQHSWTVPNDSKLIQASFSASYAYKLLRYLDVEICRFSWWWQTDRHINCRVKKDPSGIQTSACIILAIGRAWRTLSLHVTITPFGQQQCHFLYNSIMKFCMECVNFYALSAVFCLKHDVLEQSYSFLLPHSFFHLFLRNLCIYVQMLPPSTVRYQHLRYM